MPEFSLLLCLQVYFFFPLNCVSFLGRFLKHFEGLLHYNSLNEISILAVNKMLSSLLLEAYPWLWVDVALPPAQKHFLRACRLLKLPHFLAEHGRLLRSLCWGDGIKAQPHQMGRRSADSYLADSKAQQERVVGLGALTWGAPLEVTARMHGAGRPARALPGSLMRPRGFIWGYISPRLWPGSRPMPTAQPLTLEMKMCERAQLMGWGRHLRMGFTEASRTIRHCLK